MPLRPELYRRLLNVFKHVEIAHEGVEMQATLATWASNGKPTRNVIESGEYYRVNCPYCNDTRKRLWINHRWGLPDPETNTRNLWLAHCFNEECLKCQEHQKWLYLDVFADVGDGNPDVVLPGKRPSLAPRPVVWPGDLMPLGDLPADHPANTYLRNRNYDPAVLCERLQLSVCVRANAGFSMAEDRLIVPVYLHGMLMGWQARYVGALPSDDMPKYYTMPGMRKSNLLYNVDTARKSSLVVVVEGVTDVWCVGPAAVALFGKKMSEAQKLLIAGIWNQGIVVVMLDGDAPEAGQALYEALQGLVRHRVLITLPSGQDPGDMTQEELSELIQAAACEQGVTLPAFRQAPVTLGA